MHAIISCTILEENLDEVSLPAVIIRNVPHSIVATSIHME
jgi:hypothetical protein